MPTRATASAAALRTLARLCRAVAVSGDEREVRRVVQDELRDHADELKVDALGNVLVTRKGRSRRPMRVLLDAHMDEVGFMLVSDDGEGLYEFKVIGGIDARNLAGKQVVVGREHTPGVIGAKPSHMVKREERGHSLSVESLRVDLGLGGKAKPGDRGTFAPNFRRVGPSVMSKALDDRVGVALLIELVKSAPRNVELMAAFTVQEEIGYRGASVAAHAFTPDVAIVLDATPANDLPMQYEGENTFYNTKLGLGPAIYVSNSSTVDDPRLVSFIANTAERAKIPYQFRQPGGGGTNAGAIQRTGPGVPVVSVSVPHRYTHSAVSISRVEDVNNTLRLLEECLKRMSPEVLKR